MGRTKSRTRKPFLGFRKNKKLMTKKKFESKESSEINVAVDQEGQFPIPDNSLDKESSKPEVTIRSTSSEKLTIFGFDMERELSRPVDINAAKSDCYIFAQNSCLQNLFSQVLCPNCKQMSVKFDIDKERSSGFAARCFLICSNCEATFCEDYLCKRVADSKSSRSPFEINMLSTVAFRGVGCGYSAMRDWCGTMNIAHCPTQTAYQKAQAKVEEASKSTFDEVSQTSLRGIFDAYAKVGTMPDKDGILDISVSFDGSWQKRGHCSHNGMAAVIDLLTGVVIDTEVLSNYCPKCKQMEDDRNIDNVWREKHLQNCPKNFDGSSNAMEAECAVRLWSRSVEKFNLRYITMLCDGDSKSFDAVKQTEIYGKDIPIQKEDCINHVSKRMGTALRKLVDSSKNQGLQISGKGRLTKEKIVKIQNYYGRAIKDTSHDMDLLKKRIYAILFHLSSSDSHPKHMHCPPGIKSWCFWQRAQSKSEEPGSHKDHETLPADVGKLLVPIFQRLSDESLLKRCMRARTQNANESLHQIVWKICPKAMYAGRRTIETAVALAACQFSMGATYKTILYKHLSIEPGVHMQRFSQEKSMKRLKLAGKASLDAAKKRRKQMQHKSILKESKRAKKEGPSYVPGGFS